MLRTVHAVFLPQWSWPDLGDFGYPRRIQFSGEGNNSGCGRAGGVGGAGGAVPSSHFLEEEN